MVNSSNISPLASTSPSLNDAFAEPETAFWLTSSITPQADVILVTLSIRIISPSVLCAEKRSATIASVRRISQTAIPFFSRVSVLICSPVFTLTA